MIMSLKMNMYIEFMNEYVKLGHMKRVPQNEIACAPNKCYYLPHHGVVKKSSLTTKLRVSLTCYSTKFVDYHTKIS